MLVSLRNIALRETRSSNFLRHASTYLENPEKWDLLSAVSLERLPVVTRDLVEIEERFFKMLNRIELERSHKSNFELRTAADKKRAKELEAGAEADLDTQPQQTAQDTLDRYTAELNRFKFSERTDGEKVGKDAMSTLRAKDRRLLLLVKGKTDKTWLLPQGVHQGEPSLRATAERVLAEKCGKSIRVRWLGNAPAGFYKYRYPKSMRKEAVGAKIFFFKAQFIDGTVDGAKCDFQWADRSELDNLPIEYRKSVLTHLIDEEH